MMKLNKKYPFSLLAVMLLLPWPVAYAYDAGVYEALPVTIEAVEQAEGSAFEVYGGAIGGIEEPLDIFYVDATNAAADMLATLYLTNADELVEAYRYLTLKIGFYVKSDEGKWQAVTASGGAKLPEMFLTMKNGMVNFTVMGYAEYKITIDRGCYYCYAVPVGGIGLSPEFYLTID